MRLAGRRTLSPASYSSTVRVNDMLHFWLSALGEPSTARSARISPRYLQRSDAFF
jgi:hypothetical protein